MWLKWHKDWNNLVILCDFMLSRCFFDNNILILFASMPTCLLWKPHKCKCKCFEIIFCLEQSTLSGCFFQFVSNAFRSVLKHGYKILHCVECFLGPAIWINIFFFFKFWIYFSKYYKTLGFCLHFISLSLSGEQNYGHKRQPGWRRFDHSRRNSHNRHCWRCYSCSYSRYQPYGESCMTN